MPRKTLKRKIRGETKGEKKGLCIRLKKKDYQNILDYYNMPYGHIKNVKTLKKKALKTLNKKICSCIKKVKTHRRKRRLGLNDNEREKNAIAICNNAVIQRKRLKLRSFECSKESVKSGAMDLCLS